MYLSCGGSDRAGAEAPQPQAVTEFCPKKGFIFSNPGLYQPGFSVWDSVLQAEGFFIPGRSCWNEILLPMALGLCYLQGYRVQKLNCKFLLCDPVLGGSWLIAEGHSLSLWAVFLLCFRLVQLK